MRIMLINPTLQGEILAQHLGLTSAASYLNARTRHRATIVDFAFHRRRWREYLAKRVAQDRPDAVGITVSTPNLYAARLIAREVVDRYHLPLICGGTHCTLLPQQAIADLPADAVCVGEGEFTIAEFLDRLEEKRDLDGVRGLVFRRNSTVIFNRPRPVNDRIDDLPPLDWELWEDIDRHLRLYGLLSFYGTRGCPHSCAYCSSAALREALPGNYRLCDPVRYVSHVQYQWEKYRNRGLKIAWFWDQVFTEDLDWLRDFSREYRRLGLHRELPYAIYARADSLDEERCRLLHETGCGIVRIGFEAGDDFIRNQVYEKSITRADMEQAVKTCHRYGLLVTGYWILGGPGESVDTMRATLELARRLKIDVPVFYVYKPLPRTRATAKLLEWGGQISDAWQKRVLDIRFGAMVTTPKLSPKVVERFQTRCILSLIPPMVLRQMARNGLPWFGRLLTYSAYSLRQGVGPLDTLRNYLYYTTVLEAGRSLERRLVEASGRLEGRPGG